MAEGWQAGRLRARALAARELVGQLGGSLQGERLRPLLSRLARRLGHGRRDAGESGQGGRLGIDAVVDHYAQAIGGLETKPLAIGHSFGGLIVQRLLAQGLAAAAVAIDPAPIKGVLALPPSALKVASVVLRSP